MAHVNWMYLRMNGWEYRLTDQAYDWIRRFYTDPKTGEVDWEKMVKYFEEHVSKSQKVHEEEDLY